MITIQIASNFIIGCETGLVAKRFSSLRGGIIRFQFIGFGPLEEGEVAMPIKYSEQKFPAAPVLEVKISQPGESPEIEALPALIDSGGDFTTVPLNWLLQIDAPEVRWAYLHGLWSEQRPVTLYLVDLHLDK